MAGQDKRRKDDESSQSYCPNSSGSKHQLRRAWQWLLQRHYHSTTSWKVKSCAESETVKPLHGPQHIAHWRFLRVWIPACRKSSIFLVSLYIDLRQKAIESRERERKLTTTIAFSLAQPVHMVVSHESDILDSWFSTLHDESTEYFSTLHLFTSPWVSLPFRPKYLGEQHTYSGAETTVIAMR